MYSFFLDLYLNIFIFFEKLSCRTKPSYDILYDEEKGFTTEEMYR
jgi:hypothetical protein